MITHNGQFAECKVLEKFFASAQNCWNWITESLWVSNQAVAAPREAQRQHFEQAIYIYVNSFVDQITLSYLRIFLRILFPQNGLRRGKLSTLLLYFSRVKLFAYLKCGKQFV